MTDTVTHPITPAGELERLREQVLDLGETVARLTIETGAVKARVTSLEDAPPRDATSLELADAMAYLTTDEWGSLS